MTTLGCPAASSPPAARPGKYIARLQRYGASRVTVGERNLVYVNVPVAMTKSPDMATETSPPLA